MKIKHIISAGLLLLTLAACNRYVAPEMQDRTYTPKEGWQQISIEDLKAMHTLGTLPQAIDEDIYIRGIIVGDDESGNIYKSLYIQDETGGINLSIDQVNLYNIMPQGQEVIVELNGLFIGDYLNCPQIGDTATSSKYGLEMARYDWANELRTDSNGVSLAHFHPNGLPKAENIPAPREIYSANEITSDMYCTLITLKNVRIVGAESGRMTWSKYEQTLNVTAQFDDGSTLIVRTSGYSNFYTDLIPTGSGDLTGILSIYQSTQQFYLRSRDDINLTDE